MKEEINCTLERKVLLNPGPATTTSSVKKSLLVSDICPREQEFAELLQTVLLKAKEVICPALETQLNYETVLIGGSGTAAIESCLSSCLGENDKLLIVENGAYGQRMQKIAEIYGIVFETISSEWGDPIKLKEVESLLKSSAFTHIAVVHHETTTGILNDAAGLARLAKKYQLTSILDAMSSYAGLELDMQKSPYDFVISSSNKCIQGMAGLGIIVAKKKAIQELQTSKRRGLYLDLFENWKSQNLKGQFLFTPPVQVMYALHQALIEFFEEGANERYQRYEDLYKQMMSGMQELGFTPLVAQEYHSKILTAFLDPTDPHYDFNSLHDFMYERGITIYPGKGAKHSTFRMANLGDLSSKDISFFLTAMKNYIQRQGLKVS